VPGTFLTETDNDGHDTGWKKGGDSSGGGQWRLSEETQPLFPTPKATPPGQPWQSDPFGHLVLLEAAGALAIFRLVIPV
jgi:hypothetical protein